MAIFLVRITWLGYNRRDFGGVALRLMLLWLCCGMLNAAQVQGKLVDGTGGGEGSAELVQLIRLAQGMESIATLENVTGSFTLEADTPEDVQFLVQVVKDGVIYTQSLKTLQDEVEITVFETSTDVAIESRMSTLAMYAQGQFIDIGAFYTLNNVSDPPKTLMDPAGTYRVKLVPGATALDASTSRGRMPLKQTLQRDGDEGILNYALRPGPTQFNVRGRHPYNPNAENTFTVPLPPNQKAMHVLVMPMTLSIEGEGLTFVQNDEKEGVRLYEFMPLEGQTEINLKVTGSSAAPEGTQSQAAQQAHGAGEIKNLPHNLDHFRWWILGGVLFLMGVLSAVALKR